MLEKDVVIIGAGIGGLTAGAYLAKAGINVTIFERSSKPGGYCGSFSREGFIFDDAVHYINNMGSKGMLRQICEELGLLDRLRIIRIDPSDHLEMQGIRFSVFNDIGKTVSVLQNIFKKEQKSIADFFEMVKNFDFLKLYARYHQKSFQDILDEYFQSIELKTALGIFGATLGLLPDQLSALAALAYYRGSILDGGYHPIGGAQQFANVLADRFESYGGKLELKTSVKKILITNHGNIKGVELKDGSRVRSRAVISNCDATQTFTLLIDQKHISSDFRKSIFALKPSLSNFIVYLGIRGEISHDVPRCCNLWYLPFDDYRKTSVDITLDDRPDGFVHISFPSLHDRTMAPTGYHNIMIFTGASFKDKDYWESNKNRLTDVLIERASHTIPDLKNRIAIKFPATPHTLLKYTFNREGSYRGWAPTIEQSKLGLVPQKTMIRGLFLAGHWITTPIGHGGVSMVAQSGKNAARSVLSFLKVTGT